MKTKKLLSLLLALMMMLSVVPMYASAAEPIALTEANVVTWPTIEGEIYFGQKLSDGFTLSGGLVTSTGDENGSAITGKFEFIDPNYVPTSTSGIAALKFIPENTIEYQGFDVEYAWDVLYSVKTITPVLADPNSPPVATPVEEAGNRLSTSTISGGAVKNPYTGELLAGEWYWTNRRTKVEEGGYYPAELSVGVGYDVISMDIYVGIVGDAVETTITEKPTIPEIIYTPGLKWQDISLVGGKAVALGTETEVAGTFSHSLRGDVTAGTQTIDVTFTPNDITTAKSSTCQITVTINKAPIRFVDENGEDIVPEITVPYGTKYNDIARLLNPYIKGPEYVYFVMGDLSSQLCANGTYTVTATAPSDGAHYEDTELTFKIVVEKKVINPKFYSTTGGSYIQDSSGIYRPEGTFDIYVDDELVHSGIKYLEDKFELTFPENVTATYTIKAVYNPVENDNFAIADIIYQKNVIAKHGLKLKNGVANYKLGDDTLAKSITNETISITEGAVVALEAVSEDFAEWIITDAKGNALDLDIKTVVTNVDENGGITWETVDGDLSCENIIFTMPTEDVIITLRTTKDIAAENCDHICHSDNPLFQMLWKVLTFIFRLFDVQQYCDCGNLHYDAPLFG
ncbi:MAG: hypothetical protein IJB72_01890 [Clostridia bacterium]|nr:hypothetical protein [Clostridia bacterium]